MRSPLLLALAALAAWGARAEALPADPAAAWAERAFGAAAAPGAETALGCPGAAAGSAAPAAGYQAAALAYDAGRETPPALAAAGEEPLAISFGRRRGRKPKAPPAPPAALGAERARILLRSLTVPGWGQATLGHPTAATVFALAEAGVWGSFAAFHLQQQMRTDTYERTARLFAGIDLSRRDEEFRRIVGAFPSSEEYNRLVVARDAANLYLSDPQHPDYDGYRAYIEAHRLGGGDAWNWASDGDQTRFRGQRKDAQRAALRANTALALAIANRIVSAVHAARVAGRPAGRSRSWNLELAPVDVTDPTALRLAVRAKF
ncbi:MAG: hypothetical protein HZC42_05710 [Candidatus Eisenbacteria bacterium]|nr:hypothetical protein [Candidatus Eisenbacteria bacterium]